MNTFFRICVMITLLMLTFSLVANFVISLGVFPNVADIGETTETSSGLGDVTSLDSDSTMWSIFTMAAVGTGIAALVLVWTSHSLVPIGVHLFGVVFWGSWINMNSILGAGGYIPPDLLTVGTVGVMFVFIAAIVGMLTGSG